MKKFNLERQAAECIISAAMQIGVHLNKLVEASDTLPLEKRKAFKKEIGAIMGDLYTEIMLPIIRAHPELDPDKDANNQ